MGRRVNARSSCPLERAKLGGLEKCASNECRFVCFCIASRLACFSSNTFHCRWWTCGNRKSQGSSATARAKILKHFFDCIISSAWESRKEACKYYLNDFDVRIFSNRFLICKQMKRKFLSLRPRKTQFGELWGNEWVFIASEASSTWWNVHCMFPMSNMAGWERPPSRDNYSNASWHVMKLSLETRI